MTERVHVSDHAMLRYLEREHGLDLAVLQSMLAGRAVNGVRLKALSVSVGKCKMVLRHHAEGASVVSVIPARWPTIPE